MPGSTLMTVLSLALLLWPSLTLGIECLTHKLPKPTEPYAETRARLEAAGQWVATNAQTKAVPEDPQLGDTWDWYIWDLGGMPVATLKPCTIRGMGENVFVVVDDDEWNVDGMDQAAVDRIVASFDNQSVGPFPDQGIWDLNTSHFGDPPNSFDQQERIFLLYYRFNIPADGFFWVFDQYPDGSTDWASNEADVIYMATDNGDPGGDYMVGVMAHEFEHLIHFNTDEDEDAWVDEGLAELAMWLYGHPDSISNFNTNPDNSLTSWDGTWTDYIQTYLWTLYIYEQFGGQQTIWDITHQSLDGTAGYEQVLATAGYTIPIEQIFANWTIANYLDDPSLAAGQYGYTGDDLPAFNPWITHTELPAADSGDVQSWAGEYIRLTNMDAVAAYIFNGDDRRDFLINLIALDPELPTLVEPLPLDMSNDGALTFAAAAGYDEAIICVANLDDRFAGGYDYTVGSDASPVPNLAVRGLALRCSPNPFNPATELSFHLPTDGFARLLVHDCRGRLVATLQEDRMSAGEHSFTWNAKDLPSGTYIASIEIDGGVAAVRKVSLIK